jgi:putative peptidoglycan lipid II flippase
VLSTAFYALRDTRTPARIAYLRVLVSAALGAGLMVPLDRIGVGGLRLGATGLALGASAGAWVENVLLHRKLDAALGPHRPPRSRAVRIAAAGLAASVLGLATKAALGSAVPAQRGLLPSLLGADSPLVWPLAAAGTALVFGVSYLALASVLGVGVPLSRFLRK